MENAKRSSRPTASEWAQTATDHLSRHPLTVTQVRRRRSRQRQTGEHGDRERRQPRKLPKSSVVLPVLAITGVIAAAIFLVVQIGAGGPETYQAVFTAPTPRPASTPVHVWVTQVITATPQPTWTPRPEPPTATPLPTPTAIKPTPTQDMTSYYVNQFASCNGRYSGDFEDRRRVAAESAIARGYRTLPELISIIQETCQ